MPPQPSTNGVLTAPPKGVVGGNRKKQKRRAKQAAKAAQQPLTPSAGAGQPSEIDYDEDPLGYGSEEYDDYDDQVDSFSPGYSHPVGSTNGYMPPPATGKKKNKKKRGASGEALHHHDTYNPELIGSAMPPLPPHPPAQGTLPRAMHKPGGHHGNIWNTSTQQERQNIKDFWLSLSEANRKDLLKVEKEEVLRKMKQQQKHSCSCTVCGRKRTAIEEELEVLYEGYYEELEQYAHHDNPPLPSTDGMVPHPLQQRPPHPLAAPPPMAPPHHRASRIQEEFDDDELSDDEAEYSDEEEEYSEDDIIEPEPPRGIPDFFNFGQNLTVKDNLLTVADDLLKNDGRKFIEMMEQLAERRMQRESEAEYASQTNPSQHPSAHGGLPGAYPTGDGYHEDPLAAGDEYDDDEASYDSQEEYDDDLDDEDDVGHMSEEQRMQEGRRMFQIFAARMFEQRVLNAYREKVAAERQKKLLEELENEDRDAAAKEAKKQRDLEKKKNKKKQQQQAKAEEKARKDAEKAAEEARLKEAEEKKLEEQRRRKEEQRKKKDEEKRKQDEERMRKEAEKSRRQQEEQTRREEAERKAREQKAAERARKEETRKREREERDAREKESKERKSQEEREKKEREASKVKVDREGKEKEKTSQQNAQPPSQPIAPPQITKRPSQAGIVAVPGVYPKQTPSGFSSPHPAVATPAVPKAPTPAKQRQPSQQNSLSSSPKQANSQVSSAPSKSSSPGNGPQQQNSSGQQRPHVMQKQSSGNQPLHGLQVPPHSMSSQSPLQHTPIQPPPGMSGHPQHHPAGFGGMQPMGFQGFPHQNPMMHNMGQRGPMPGVHGFPPHQGPQMGMPGRMNFGAPGVQSMNGMSGPPPGMGQMQSTGRGMPSGGFPFDNSGAGPPPGLGGHMQMQHQSTQSQTTSPIGPPPAGVAPGDTAQRHSFGTHSRQLSTDKERFESAANQPIARPAPIQRPSSVKPQDQGRRGSNMDMEDLSKHLGSSALLDDSDEPLLPDQENRRSSNIPIGARNGPIGGAGPIGSFGAPGPVFGGNSNWPTPALPFGQSPGLGSQQWGSLPATGLNSWNQNHNSFASNNAFGGIGGTGSMHRPAGAGMNRPLAIRLAVCQACKQLTNAARGEGDGFHNVDILLRQMEANRGIPDNLPTLREIEEICETEGDSQNGGGELSVRKSASDEVSAVKWDPDNMTPDQSRGSVGGLGEIGSPMPSKTSPVGSFGAPGMGRAPGSGFQSLGAVGSSNY